jgi:hypothetical protein
VNQPSNKPKKKPQQCLPSPAGILWGARAIGAEIGKAPRQVFYLLESGKLPAQRVGRQWVTTKAKIREWLNGSAIH